MSKKYRGYHASFELQDGDYVSIVRTENDTIVAVAASIHEQRAALQEAIDDYIAYCQEKGKAPEKQCTLS